MLDVFVVEPVLVLVLEVLELELLLEFEELGSMVWEFKAIAPGVPGGTNWIGPNLC